MSGTNKSPNVAIVGRPNVGKSALFNCLIGRKIAIVHDQPGITRDRISAVCTRGTQPFVVWDTGGVAGKGESELPRQVRHAVEEAIHDSDLLLFLVDAKQGLSPLDQELAQMLRKSQKPVVLVINKIDTEKHENLAIDFASLGFSESLSISAAHSRGISELIETIDQLLPSPSTTDQSPGASHQSLSIAIIGRPNVGKSSLINSIVHSERAIVSELPGTTRDAIDISYERNGQQFLFIDTAGIRRRGKHVFSAMRAERSIRRADLCVLIVDLTMGVTAQDKRIGGLIQKAHKAAIVVLNKWDLIRPKRSERKMMAQLIDETRARIFFLDYAPVLIASALTGENIEKLFEFIAKVRRAAREHIGTGILNRLLRSAFASNPPPMISGRRLKLLYAAQAGGNPEAAIEPPKFVLFVNEPRLLSETYHRYLETRIRKAQPYPGLPVILTCRPRQEKRRK